jgi:hypothetical protein
MADDIEIVLVSDSITQIDVGAQQSTLAAAGFASIKVEMAAQIRMKLRLWNGDLFFELFADSRSRNMSRQIHRVVE